MESKEKNGGFGLWGIVAGVCVVLVSIVMVALLFGGGDDDRAGEELTWVG